MPILTKEDAELRQKLIIHSTVSMDDAERYARIMKNRNARNQAIVQQPSIEEIIQAWAVLRIKLADATLEEMGK